MTNYNCFMGKEDRPWDCTQELFSAPPAIWMVLSYRGHKHSCLPSQVFLWFQSQGCQEQLQPLKLWVGTWAQTQNPSFPACTSVSLSMSQELHSRTTPTALALKAIIQWTADDKSDFIKAKLSSGIASLPKNHISHHKLDTSSACFRENEPSWGQAQHWGACTDLQKDCALCLL